jgi:replicative DNA helicase
MVTVLESEHFAPVDDAETLQAVVLGAAIKGNADVRPHLASLLSAFEEPYRTVATITSEKLLAGEFVDQHTLGAALRGKDLRRRTANGQMERLSATEVLQLIFATDEQPGQALAYVEVLRAQQEAKRQAEFRDDAAALVAKHRGSPGALVHEIEELAADARRRAGDGASEHPHELLELIPYVRRLSQSQSGSEFLGLDSGFQHVNNLCNGLAVGLCVLAAPPAKGKSTRVWQIACQAANANKVPVIFLSMEQSKDELRAKVLSRLSKLHYRHILRGRLHAGDADQMGRLLAAAREYAGYAQHITVVEGDETTTIDVLREIAKQRMAQARSERCLICVDYLQILPAREQDAKRITSAKDRVDLHVSSLRRLARQLDSPVVAISAENRAGYGSTQLDVFKESGGIEYSADIAMILKRATDQEQNANYRKLDLNVVKNRNGERGVVRFKFYPERAEFIEEGKTSLPEDQD